MLCLGTEMPVQARDASTTASLSVLSWASLKPSDGEDVSHLSLCCLWRCEVNPDEMNLRDSSLATWQGTVPVHVVLGICVYGPEEMVTVQQEISLVNLCLGKILTVRKTMCCRTRVHTKNAWNLSNRNVSTLISSLCIHLFIHSTNIYWADSAFVHRASHICWVTIINMTEILPGMMVDSLFLHRLCFFRGFRLTAKLSRK